VPYAGDAVWRYPSDAAHRQADEPLLFDTVADPGQEHNLVEEQPDELERMRGFLEDALRDLDAPAEHLERYGFEQLSTVTAGHQSPTITRCERRCRPCVEVSYCPDGVDLGFAVLVFLPVAFGVPRERRIPVPPDNQGLVRLVVRCARGPRYGRSRRCRRRRRSEWACPSARAIGGDPRRRIALLLRE